MQPRVVSLLGLCCLAACGSYVPGVHCAQDSDCDKGARCLCVDPKTCTAPTDCSTEGKCACINPKACTSDTECGMCQVCRGSPGYCEAEKATEDVKNECAEGPCATGFCNGSGACDLKPKGTVCRAANDDCDAAETCSGTEGTCPEDKVADVGTVCRPAAGSCDVAEACNGTSRDCPANVFQPAGHECAAETCVGSTHTPRRTCDGSGTCKAVDTESCGLYACGSTKCKTLCATNADCVSEAVCDEEEGSATSPNPAFAKCQAATKVVDCTVAAGALQAAIDSCPASSTCYLRVAAGSCENITIQNKLVYISGERGPDGTPATTIQPSKENVVAVSVKDDQTAKAVLVGLIIKNAHGSANPEGVSCVGTASVSNPHVSILRSVIQSNAGAGINASYAMVTVHRSKILDNGGDGLFLQSSSFDLVNNFIAGNGGTNGGYGVQISAGNGVSTSIFEYNTVAINRSGGMYCSGPSALTIVSRSLLWDPDKPELDGGKCTPDTATQVGTSKAICPGIAASTGPGFVNANDFHLAPGSRCRGVIECDSAVSTDIDGDPRPVAGKTCSPGADE